MKDMCEWTGLDTYDKVKRAAEERENWRLKIGKYRYKVDKRKSKVRKVKRAADEREMEAHSCQPSCRSRQMNE